MFLNLSNHTSEKWCKEQKDAAIRLVRESGGMEQIEDFPFPQVSAAATEEEVSRYAEQIVADVLRREPTVVMCQGEFTLTYQIVKRLQEASVKVVAACSERRTEEVVLEDGSTKREAIFVFVRFREYE